LLLRLLLRLLRLLRMIRLRMENNYRRAVPCWRF
jgi:hypothetical protein